MQIWILLLPVNARQVNKGCFGLVLGAAQRQRRPTGQTYLKHFLFALHESRVEEIGTVSCTLRSMGDGDPFLPRWPGKLMSLLLWNLAQCLWMRYGITFTCTGIPRLTEVKF